MNEGFQVAQWPPSHSGVFRDRRRAPRVELDTPALIDSGHHWFKGRCRNVSATGLLVKTDREVALGSVVDVYFELPNGVAVDTEARVVRRQGDSMCLRFTRPRQRSVAALGFFVRSARLGRHGILRAG